jgi:hypothetical protein
VNTFGSPAVNTFATFGSAPAAPYFPVATTAAFPPVATTAAFYPPAGGIFR